MKRFLLAATASVMAIGPLAATAAYADPPHRYDRGDRYDRHDRYDRWDNRGEYRGHHWRRGDRLPSAYRDRYRPVDYRHAHLRAPPRGYHYVRDDNSGETLLVGIATGVILGVILSQ